ELDREPVKSSLSERIKKAEEALAGTGTRVLLLVDDSARSLMDRFGPYMAHGRMRLDEPRPEVAGKGVQVMVITPELASAILDKGHVPMKKAARTAARKRVVVQVPVTIKYAPAEEKLSAANVLGYVEGSDKKGEYLFVTAHYDHLGVIDGEVYNGADDDASGTAAVLEMAQAF